MKKWVIPVALAVICLLTISVNAADSRINNITPVLSFNGTTANCEVEVYALGNSIDATMELWSGSSLVASWHKSGASIVLLNGSCTVTKGKTYTLKTYGTIDGVRFTGPSVSKTC